MFIERYNIFTKRTFVLIILVNFKPLILFGVKNVLYLSFSMSKYLSFCILFFFFLTSSAQNDINVSGTVLDINTQLPIEFATVFFSNVKDSTVIDYTTTDKNGVFKLNTKKYETPVFLKVNHTDYQTFVEEQSSLLENKNFGKLYLLNHKYALNDVVIVQDVPMKIKKDTLEFNAASFKVRPDANVETLLKQLPGVDIDSDGKITVNGKDVTQFLVNGKPFFDKDGAMALKNLPADIISKIQVSDFKTKKEELAKQESTSDFASINITIDEKKNKGIFGKFLAGYGSSDRYESSFILNFFNNKQKISVLASSNNINATGFSMDDVFDNMGGGRNNKKDVTASAGGRGITQSNIAGFSYSDEWSKNVEAVGSYDFKNTTNTNESKAKQLNFLPAGANITDSKSKTKNENTTNKANFELEYKIDPTTRLIFTPNLSQSHSNNSVIASSDTQNDKGEALNESDSRSSRDNNNFLFGNTINFNKVFKKKSRNLSFVFANTYSTNDSDALIVSKTVFFVNNRPNIERNQNSLTNTTLGSYSADLEYTEPITDSLRVRVGVDLDWSKDENDLKTYDFDSSTQSYTDLNESQSNFLSSSRNSIRPKVGVTYEKNKYTINLNSSTAVTDYDNHSLYLNKATDLNQKYFLPFANVQIRYKINRSKFFSLKYDYSNSLPTALQLMPVANLSNPLNTILGNPDLNPTETQTASISFKNYNFRARTGYNIYLKSDFYQNEIVSTALFDANGKKTTTYVNIDDTFSTSFGGNWNQSIKKEAHVLRYGLSLNGNYSFDKGFTNAVFFSTRAIRVTPGIYVSYDYGELFTIAPSYRITYNETRYKNYLIDANSTVLHNVNLQTTTYWPENWVFGNDFGYAYNSNLSSDFRKDFILWNTSLSYSFFEKKMMLKMKVYDVLNQNQSVTRNLSPTAIRDEENTVLKRYAMFSLTYKMGEFRGKKKKGKQKDRLREEDEI
jgi:Outer membrane protein beta-barrel family